MTQRQSLEFTVETLENRMLLTGNVIVKITPSGDLIVRGDAGDNNLGILDNGNAIVIVGRDFESINGGPQGGVIGMSVPPSGIRNVRISLGAGNDYLTLDGSAAGRDIRINSGTGNDLISVRNSLIGGSLRVATASGNDAVALVNVFAQKQVFVNMGSGNDILGSACVLVSGSLRVSMGSGNDSFVGTRITAQNVTLNTGSGNDIVAMDQSTILGNFQIRLGSGNDGAAFGTGTIAFGSWQVNGGSGTDQLVGLYMVVRQMEAIDPSVLNADALVVGAGQLFALAWVVSGGNLTDLVGCP